MKDKQHVFLKATDMLNELQFTVINKDDSRPWGGFYVINETEAAEFFTVLD